MNTGNASPLGGSKTPGDESLRRSNSGSGSGTGVRRARSKEDARTTLFGEVLQAALGLEVSEHIRARI